MKINKNKDTYSVKIYVLKEDQQLIQIKKLSVEEIGNENIEFLKNSTSSYLKCEKII